MTRSFARKQFDYYNKETKYLFDIINDEDRIKTAKKYLYALLEAYIGTSPIMILEGHRLHYLESLRDGLLVQIRAVWLDHHTKFSKEEKEKIKEFVKGHVLIGSMFKTIEEE